MILGVGESHVYWLERIGDGWKVVTPQLESMHTMFHWDVDDIGESEEYLFKLAFFVEGVTK